jgi:hypothetical protein
MGGRAPRDARLPVIVPSRIPGTPDTPGAVAARFCHTPLAQWDAWS